MSEREEAAAVGGQTTSAPREDGPVTTNNVTLEAARDLIRREGAGVSSVADQLDETFLQVVDLLLHCRGKVFVTGSGTSGAVARRMAHLLAVCSTPAVFLPAMDALHGTMGAVVEGDVLITISRGGESDELNQLSQRVQARGVPVVALTAQPDSTLGRLADITVVVDGGSDVDPGGVVAMGSTLVASVWGDALAYVLMRLRDYSWDQVLFTHPAGAVGRLSAAPEQLPPLHPTEGDVAKEG